MKCKTPEPGQMRQGIVVCVNCGQRLRMVNGRTGYHWRHWANRP